MSKFEQKQSETIERVRSVARELGLVGRSGEWLMLGHELDKRGIRCPVRGWGCIKRVKWIDKQGSVRLQNFIKRYLPDIREREAVGLLEFPGRGRTPAPIFQVDIPILQARLSAIANQALRDCKDPELRRRLEAVGSFNPERRPSLAPQKAPKARKSNGAAQDLTPGRLDTPVRQEWLAKKVSKKESVSNPVRHNGLANGKSAALNIAGWSVRKDGKGYFRAYRKVAGKTRSVYLGKTLQGAEEKILKADKATQSP